MQFSVGCPTCGETVGCEVDLSDAYHGDVLRSLFDSCPKCKEPFVTEVKVNFEISVRVIQPPSETA